MEEKRAGETELHRAVRTLVYILREMKATETFYLHRDRYIELYLDSKKNKHLDRCLRVNSEVYGGRNRSLLELSR